MIVGKGKTRKLRRPKGWLVAVASAAVGVGALVLAGILSRERPAPAAFVGRGDDGRYPAPVVTVKVEDFAFEPAEVVVEPATIVRWEQRDPFLHNVHVAPDPAQNGLTAPLVGYLPTTAEGAELAIRFDEEGRYEYWCEPHPFMNGAVVVRESR